jgi:hypothetical protein
LKERAALVGCCSEGLFFRYSQKTKFLEKYCEVELPLMTPEACVTQTQKESKKIKHGSNGSTLKLRVE